MLLIPATGIGDTVQFSPVVRNLKMSFPEAQITLVAGSKAAARVFAGSPHLAHTFILKDRTHLSWLSFALRARLSIGSVDTILAGAGMSPACPEIFGADLVVAFQERNELDRRRSRRWISLARNLSLNEVEENLRLLRPLGIEAADRNLELVISEQDDSYVSSLWSECKLGDADPVIAIHTRCDTPEKQWEEERFALLVRALLASCPGCRVVLLGGPHEDVEGFLNRIDQNDRAFVVNLVGRTTVLQTSAALRRCRVLVSNDSSVTHLAAAVGTPVVVLFGPSDPRRVSPWNPDGEVRVVRASLDCSPCYLLYSGRIHGREGSNYRRCMTARMTPLVLDDVLEVATV